MLKKSIIILSTCLSFSVLSAEFEFSLGGGFQYSGVIGTQFAIKHNDSKYFVSVGLPGYSVGMQTTISEDQHHSAGFSVGQLNGILDSDSKYGFLTYNYHVRGFNNSGWVFGTGLGAYREDAYTTMFSGERVKPSAKAMFTLDIGYKF